MTFSILQMKLRDIFWVEKAYTDGLCLIFFVQVRGTVAEERMTLEFAIGKNTTEGKTHMMCIEGGEGQYPVLNTIAEWKM